MVYGILSPMEQQAMLVALELATDPPFLPTQVV